MFVFFKADLYQTNNICVFGIDISGICPLSFINKTITLTSDGTSYTRHKLSDDPFPVQGRHISRVRENNGNTLRSMHTRQNN